jgi:hypothetical protein
VKEIIVNFSCDFHAFHSICTVFAQPLSFLTINSGVNALKNIRILACDKQMKLNNILYRILPAIIFLIWQFKVQLTNLRSDQNQIHSDVTHMHSCRFDITIQYCNNNKLLGSPQRLFSEPIT